MANAMYQAIEFSNSWEALLSVNLAVASLLRQAADIAYDNGCHDGIAPEAGYREVYNSGYPTKSGRPEKFAW